MCDIRAPIPTAFGMARRDDSSPADHQAGIEQAAPEVVMRIPDDDEVDVLVHALLVQ